MATVAPALFQTRCSSCDAVQSVTQEALRTNTGLLRCTHCDQVFNAAWSLVDQIPNPARRVDPASSPQDPPFNEYGPASHDSQAHTPREIAGEAFGMDALAAEPAGFSKISSSVDLHGRKEPTLVIGEHDAQTLPGGALPAGPPPRSARSMSRGLLLAGIALVVIALFAQVRFPLLEAVASVAATRPALGVLCRYTGCQLPAPTEGPVVSVTRSSMDLHRHRPDALVLRVHLLNHSTTVQDYPAVEVTLNNVVGEVVGRRTYLPREFGVTDETRKLQGGRDAVVTLVLAKSDPAVSGVTARAVQF